MANRIAVVTGGNKGIGFAIVRKLCNVDNLKVYLTSRDVGRGEDALAELKEEGLYPVFHQLDIEDEKSVTKFADYIKETDGGIDILVNNAAIAFKHDAKEPFSHQAEVTLRVNFFSTARACKILFPLLRPHARVVNVSSSAGHLSRIPGKKIKEKLASENLTEDEVHQLMNDFIAAAKNRNHHELGWPSSAYAVSKVGLSALTRIQQKQFLTDPREDIVINHVHPGYVDTDMTSHKGPLTIDEGAAAPAYLALLPPNIKSPKGAYVWCNSKIVDWVKGPLPAQY